MNASKVCLKINFKKTKILHAGHNSQPNPVTTINGYTLEIFNDFLYLGVSTKRPLNVVLGKHGRAWFAIGKLRPIFISKISDANKMRLFIATVKTIPAYGLESVPLTRSICRQIDAYHRQLVRAALGITWPETISTAELSLRAKLIPLSRTIRKRLGGVVVTTPSRGSQTPARGPPSFSPHTSSCAATPTGSVHKSQTVSVVGMSGQLKRCNESWFGSLQSGQFAAGWLSGSILCR